MTWQIGLKKKLILVDLHKMAKTVGKCACGGSLKQYDAVGFLPKTIKCNRCGAGEGFDEGTSQAKINQVIKLLKKGYY